MAEETSPQSFFRLENIIVKNISLEMPEGVVTPVFSKDKEPTIQLELRNSFQPLRQDGYYEVTLEATVRVKNGEELQLLIEAMQAGIYSLREPDNERRDRLLNILAPEMLYPYLSQLICELLMRAGAPRVFLPPFNFRAIYERKQQARRQKLAEQQEKDTSNA